MKAYIFSYINQNGHVSVSCCPYKGVETEIRDGFIKEGKTCSEIQEIEIDDLGVNNGK